MASYGLRKMLYLTISNTLGVLVFVHPECLQKHVWYMVNHICSDRCCAHRFMLADVMQNVADRIPLWEMLWLHGCVDKCGRYYGHNSVDRCCIIYLVDAMLGMADGMATA